MQRAPGFHSAACKLLTVANLLPDIYVNAQLALQQYQPLVLFESSALNKLQAEGKKLFSYLQMVLAKAC